jgi:signal peptidase I
MVAPANPAPPPSRELFADDDLGADEPSTGRTAVEWIVVVAGAVAVALLVKTFALQAFFIPSPSMEPTLRGGIGGQPGDRVLVDKLSYHLRGPARGDIVVFHAPPDFPEPDVDDLIKRVVGVAGDRITFEKDKVKVNGSLIDEPYLSPGTPTQPVPEARRQYGHACTPEDECVVPPGHVWVMGDNRTNSEDSRYIGPVDENLVVGRAFVLLWPFNRLSGL